jgi:hypothetical protein
MYIFHVEAPSYAELRARLKAELQELTSDISVQSPAAREPILSEDSHAAIDGLIGQYTRPLLRFVCEEIVSGRVPNSDGFKQLTGRTGSDGRWIGPVTKSINRFLFTQAHTGLTSQYDERGAATWVLEPKLAAEILRLLERS